MNVEIKNISGASLPLLDTTLSIDNKNSIPNGSTVAVRSNLADFWQDATLAAALAANQIEVYINSLLVPKAAATRQFNTPQLNYAVSRYNDVTAATFNISASPLNQVFLANRTGGGGVNGGGDIQFIFPAANADNVGVVYEIIQLKDGLIDCTCGSNSFLAERVLPSPYQFRCVGAVMQFVCIYDTAANTYYWAVKNNNSIIRGAQLLGEVSMEMVFPANITNPQHDWNPLTGATDSYALYTRTTALVLTQITGIQNPAANFKNRKLLILNSILSTAALSIVNNSGSSSANNRFEMDASVTIPIGGSQEFIYNTTRLRWNKA